MKSVTSPRELSPFTLHSSLFSYGATEAPGIYPRAIEAAGASLAFGEHIAGTLDPLQVSLFPLGGLDPLDPIPARDGRDA